MRKSAAVVLAAAAALSIATTTQGAATGAPRHRGPAVTESAGSSLQTGIETVQGVLTFIGEIETPLLARPPAAFPWSTSGPAPPEPEVVPIDPTFDPIAARPSGRGMSLDERLFGPPPDVQIFRSNRAIAAALPPTAFLFKDEPTFASQRDLVFYAGTHYASLSGDGGITWSYVDPARFGPPIGAGAAVEHQALIDERSRDLLIWVLQYAAGPTGHNILRIAVATRVTALAPISWKVYEVLPETFGSRALVRGEAQHQADLDVRASRLRTGLWRGGDELQHPMRRYASGCTSRDMWIIRPRGGATLSWNEGGSQVGSRDDSNAQPNPRGVPRGICP